jgi:hypothetical protein
LQGFNPDPSVGQISPDGLWHWDGAHWVPTGGAGVNAPPAIHGYAAAAEASKSPRSSLVTAGSVTALAAVVMITAGCILPYVHYAGDTTGINPSPSIFNGGFSGAWGDVTEPAVVILFSIVASILALASTSRTVRALMAGALLAMGAQTFTLFVGYGVAGAAYGQLQAGSIVGPVGAILLFVGGALIGASLLQPDPNRR